MIRMHPAIAMPTRKAMKMKRMGLFLVTPAKFASLVSITALALLCLYKLTVELMTEFAASTHAEGSEPVALKEICLVVSLESIETVAPRFV